MKLECSWQCSQNPATGPYRESDKSSPHFPSLNSIIHPSTSNSYKWHFTSGSHTKTHYASPPLYTRHTHTLPVTLPLTWSLIFFDKFLHLKKFKFFRYEQGHRPEYFSKNIYRAWLINLLKLEVAMAWRWMWKKQK